MKILIVDTFYDSIWQSVYRERLGLGPRRLSGSIGGIAWCGFWLHWSYAKHLKDLGHEVMGIVMNCIPLQQAWMREHKLTCPPGYRWAFSRRNGLVPWLRRVPKPLWGQDVLETADQDNVGPMFC